MINKILVSSRIMKPKLKQRWPTILPISTKEITISHLKSLNIQMTTTYEVVNPSPGLG